MELRVAGAQIPVVEDDLGANVSAIGRAIEFAASESADVLLTPEGSLSGYTHRFDQAAVAEALADIVRRAASKRLALALGTCFIEPDDGRCYNQVRFYDAAGCFLGFHAKVLRCGSLEDSPKGELNHYAARPLRTFELCGLTVGALICNDLWANPGCTPEPDPHLSQQLATMGARVILHAVNGGRGPADRRAPYRAYHESNLQLRARAGEVWIVVADNCYPPELDTSCPSGVVGPDGDWVVRAPTRGEQFFAHSIELDAGG